MEKSSNFKPQRYQKKLWILIVLLFVFAAGFLIARARYKPQIRTSFDMVMERETLINDLKTRIQAYEDKIRMEMQKATKTK